MLRPSSTIKPFAIAGLWERWAPPGQEPLESFALLTTEANAVLAPIQEASGVLEKLAALQTQVATLVNQSRLLARDMADAKQEGASLQAMVTQYKQEIEESRASLTPIPPTTSAQTQPSVTPAVPPQQAAQAAPVTPAKSATAPQPTKGEPAPTDESWTDWIKNMVSSLWSWIFN